MGLFPYNFKKGQIIQTDVSRFYADRSFVAHLEFATVDAASVNGVLSATALTDAVQTITTNITNPDHARNLSVKGNAGGVQGNVVITGTNIADEVITETIILNDDSNVLGNKAFKTITSIQLPVEFNVGTDTVSVGWGDKIGLPYKLVQNTVLHAHLNNVRESSYTVVTNASALESNTIDLNSALNGDDVDIYLVV